MRKPLIYASASKGQVVVCECERKMVHVQYGNCTLTLTETEFLDFSLMVDEASTKLHPIKQLTQLARE